MWMLRLIIPIAICYLADLAVFEGEYFGRFAESAVASSAYAQLPGANSLRVWDAEEFIETASSCRLDSGRVFVCH